MNKQNGLNNSYNPSIGVIIPVYNSENNIERCINSILKQTYNNFLIYVVNDGSTDRTNEKLAKFSKNPYIYIINQTNQGVSAARNAGISEANVDYIAFIDSDDYVENNYLMNLLKEYKNNKIDLAINGYKKLQNNKEKCVKYPYEGIFSAQEAINIILQDDGPKGYLWNKLWKNEIIKKYNIKFKINIKLAEDLLFAVEYIEKCKKITINNTNGYVYNLNTQGLSGTIEVNGNKSNFNSSFLDYLQVLKEVSIILRKNNWSMNKIYSRLGVASSRYMRFLIINNKSATLEKKRKILRSKCSQYKKYVFKDKKLSLKTKIVYCLSLYLPLFLSKLDKKRMSD